MFNIPCQIKVVQRFVIKCAVWYISFCKEKEKANETFIITQPRIRPQTMAGRGNRENKEKGNERGEKEARRHREQFRLPWSVRATSHLRLIST